MNKRLSLSIVIPVHNEGRNTVRIHDAIKQYIDDDVSEFLYVDDGSRDDSVEHIESLMKHDKRVRLVSFSRNFGKEAATTAGLLECTGNGAVIIDCDGQFPPRLLPEFVKLWREGNEVVIGKRETNERAGFIKNAGSALYYRILKVLHSPTGVRGDTDFRLIDRVVIEAFRELSDHNRVTRALINWLGFKTAFIPFDADAREHGEAGYSFMKLFRLAIDGMTTTSMRPLLFSSLIGGAVFGFASLLGIFMLIEQYALGDPLSLGFTGSAYLAVLVLIMTGIILVGQGIQGAYLANIYTESRNRPLYVIRRKSARR